MGAEKSKQATYQEISELEPEYHGLRLGAYRVNTNTCLVATKYDKAWPLRSPGTLRENPASTGQCRERAPRQSQHHQGPITFRRTELAEGWDGRGGDGMGFLQGGLYLVHKLRSSGTRGRPDRTACTVCISGSPFCEDSECECPSSYIVGLWYLHHDHGIIWNN